jgi:type IV fimbrial biogenesis protein FimT
MAEIVLSVMTTRGMVQPQESLRMHSASRERRAVRGFTLLEVLTVLAILGVLMGIAIPVVNTAIQRYTLNSAARNVGAAIRSARYGAVAKNRTLVLRFNCPANGQYRMLEFTGTLAIDTAADRCSTATYPFPDTTPGVAPDADGPVATLDPGVSFGAVTDLAFNATGRIPAVATIEVTNGTQTRRITVAPGGRITEQ